ncbi:DNA polymerase III subunit beta [Caldichromatium japonicum]|uniref:Beta sliding clamp n=1 Tax=Caldichromatium japonicum TaxID=2699430 RepID=A0A6G7VGI4_9GAMM|nr:DNA polymerase III subunit beta [Caldichromatium japonicum]QIK39020.1 DNA polymerase III subunit beta [Caldichromatium japonicum]
MEFVVDREVILPALNRVIGVIERRQTLPILGNFAVLTGEDRLLLTASDLDIEVKTQCPAKVIESGETTIPARKLYEICRSLGDGTEIRLKVRDDRCTLTAGRSRFTLATLPAQDFPCMESGVPFLRLSLPEHLLRRLIDKTAFAMAQQDVRHYLNGLLWDFKDDTLVTVATDGHRLAKYVTLVDAPSETPLQAIVPYKTVSELKRQLKSADGLVQIAVGERHIHIATPEFALTSKLIDGRFPDYERVIPVASGEPAVSNLEDLRRALNRVAILSNDKYRGVRLDFASGALRITATNPEQEEAEEEVELSYSGEPVSIGFNVAYLLDALGAIDEEMVAIQIQDVSSSSLWRGLGAEAETYVVMPMRL